MVSMYVTGTHKNDRETFDATAVVTYGSSTADSKTVRIELYAMQPPAETFAIEGQMEMTVDGEDMLMWSDISSTISSDMPQYTEGAYTWNMQLIGLSGDFYTQTTEMMRMRRMQGMPGTETAAAAGAAVQLNLQGDHNAVRVELPFTFNFFGEETDAFWVAIDGYISSGKPMMGAIVPDLTLLNNAIAPFYADLYADESSSITVSATRDEHAVITWSRMWVLSMSERVDFSVTLHADSSCVSFDHISNPLEGSGHFAAGMVDGDGQVLAVDHSSGDSWNMCPWVVLGGMEQHSDTGGGETKAYIHAEGLWNSMYTHFTATFRAQVYDSTGRMLQEQDYPLVVHNGKCFDGVRTPSRSAAWCANRADACDVEEIALDCPETCDACEEPTVTPPPTPVEQSPTPAPTQTPAPTPTLSECQTVNDSPKYSILCAAIAEQCPDYCDTKPVFRAPSPTPSPSCEDASNSGACDISSSKLKKKCKNSKFEKKCMLSCGSCNNSKL